MAAFADIPRVFADLRVRGGGLRRSLAMVGQDRILEAAMAATQSARQRSTGWVLWVMLAVGAGLLAVELNAGMEYVEAGFQQNSELACLPAAGMLTLRLAEQSVCHWGTVESLLRAVPLLTLGFLLVGLGVAARRRQAQ